MRYVVTGLRRNLLILAAVVLFLAGGCVTVEKRVQPIEEESLEIVELKKAISGLYMKTEEMNNRLFLLQEKADTSDERIDVLEGGSVEIDGESGSGLKVGQRKDEKVEDDGELVEEVVREETVAETHSILFTESDDSEEGIVAPDEPSAEEEASPLGTPEDLYEVAMKDLKDKNYREARVNFVKLYVNYPEHSLADNAVYWTGECYYVERDYQMALDSFMVVYSKYPDGNKAADAMLKTAYAYISLKDRGSTIKALNLLMEKYPDSDAAQKANERFKRKK